jgi:monofunctional biosynthetic peptidoglycan transglycosylase
MLDQKPDRPGDREDAEDASFVDVPKSSESGQASAGSGGGMLGRFRAGVRAQPGDGRTRKPLWRRILVFLLVWMVILAVAFLALSAAAVLLFRYINPPPTLTMAQRAMGPDGVTIQRTWVPLDRISVNLVRAVMADEDQRFCQHDGFDRIEIEKALADGEAGKRLRGASTLTQQTAKNVFLWQEGGWTRKGLEVWFALLIDKTWTKRRQMEVYLNIAEWGDGLFGAEAAAKARFGVAAKDLTMEQAARLAAVLPNPNKWAVDGNYAVHDRAPWILRNMEVIRRDRLDGCIVDYK